MPAIQDHMMSPCKPTSIDLRPTPTEERDTLELGERVAIDWAYEECFGTPWVLTEWDMIYDPEDEEQQR